MSKRSKPELIKSPSLTFKRDKYLSLMCKEDEFGFDAMFTSWRWNYSSEDEPEVIHLKDCVLRHTIDKERGLIEGREFYATIDLGRGKITFFDAFHKYSNPEHVIDPVYVKYNFRCYPDRFLESEGKMSSEDIKEEK